MIISLNIFGDEKMKERWLNFILPHIHKWMESIRLDPECSYDEWKQIKQNYKDSIGREYERTKQN